jgi:hypothetical protein
MPIARRTRGLSDLLSGPFVKSSSMRQALKSQVHLSAFVASLGSESTRFPEHTSPKQLHSADIGQTSVRDIGNRQVLFQKCNERPSCSCAASNRFVSSSNCSTLDIKSLPNTVPQAYFRFGPAQAARHSRAHSPRGYLEPFDGWPGTPCSLRREIFARASKDAFP